MKNQLTILLFLFISFAGYSQTEVGVKIGPSYTFINEDFGKAQVRYHAGLYTREAMGKINFLFEAFYNNVAFKNSGKTYQIHAVNMPFLLETQGDISFHAGVNTSLILSSPKVQSEGISTSIKPFSIDAAAGLSFKLADKLRLLGRVTYPIVNVSEGKKYNPLGVNLSLSYAFKTFDK